MDKHIFDSGTPSNDLDLGLIRGTVFNSRAELRRDVANDARRKKRSVQQLNSVLLRKKLGSMSFRVETAYAEGHRGYDEVKGGRSPGEAEPLTSPYPRQRFRKADGGRQPPSAWRTIATFRLYRDRS